MKILIIIFFMTMEPNLESFIGKSINEVPNPILMSDENLSNRKVYQVNGTYSFMERTYHNILFNTTKNDTIVNAVVSLYEKMDRAFYDLIVKEYGSSSTMFKVDTFVTEEPTQGNGYIATRGQGTTRPCDFDEGPLYICWDKNGFNIEVQISFDNDHTIVSIGTEKSLFPQMK